jgi:hypothetical protein
MRRLLTGYALWFNKKHNRFGHLFQNRYKSILCQEETYLLELVRYIHLNPLRAKVVKNLDALDRYPYCGHSALMAKETYPWQDVDNVLRLFGQKAGYARRSYRAFMQKGVELGKREDLIGGGLVRSAGGWAHVRAIRAAKVFEKSDERILGDGEFVESVLAAANEAMLQKYELQSQGMTLDKVAERVAEVLGMEVHDVWATGRYPSTVEARSLLCYWAVRELGMTMTSLSRRLSISTPGVSKAVKRGELLAKEKKYSLLRE